MINTSTLIKIALAIFSIGLLSFNIYSYKEYLNRKPIIIKETPHAQFQKDTVGVLIIEDLGDRYNIIWKHKINNCDAQDVILETLNCKRL